jgi:flagellar assembly protein FliH
MSTPAQPARPAKFNFDTSFGTKGTPSSTQAARPRSAYSADEVEMIRKESFAAGKVAATAEDAHAQAMALSAISQSMSVLIQQFDGQLAALRDESAQLALAVGRKLAESALEMAPQAETIAMLGECMHKLHAEPRLVVRVAADIGEAVKAQIEPLSERHGFSGRVVVMIEPAFPPMACRIEWADGGIEQDLNSTFAAIQEHVIRWQAARTGEGN